MNEERYYVRRYNPGWAIYSRTMPGFPVRLYGLTDRDEVMRICEEMNIQDQSIIPGPDVPHCITVN